MILGLASWMRQLNPPTSSSAVLRSTRARSEVLQLLGSGPESWLATLAHTSSEFVGRRDPDFTLARDRVLLWLEWLDAKTLLALCGFRPSVQVDGEDEQFITELVQRGITFDQLLRMIHLHQGQFTLALYDSLRTVAPVAEQAEAMAAVEHAIYRLLDEFSSALAKTHSDALAAWTATGEATRAAVVRGLVNGTVDPIDFQRRTGYRLDRNHVALIAFSPTSEPKKLTAAALGTLRAAGCRTTVHALLAPNLLWAWGTLEGTVKTISHPAPPCPGCTVTMGMPGEGIRGFLASHHEAEAVHSLDSLVEWQNLGRSLAYNDLGMIAEMAARPERLRRFIVGQLGPLALEGAYAAELRATLLAYLETNRSTTEAAVRLHVAKNTVTYRLRRAEELLGHDFTADQVPLQCALSAIDVLGPGFISSHEDQQHQEAGTGQRMAS